MILWLYRSFSSMSLFYRDTQVTSVRSRAVKRIITFLHGKKKKRKNPSMEQHRVRLPLQRTREPKTATTHTVPLSAVSSLTKKEPHSSAINPAYWVSRLPRNVFHFSLGKRGSSRSGAGMSSLTMPLPEPFGIPGCLPRLSMSFSSSSSS